MNDSLRFRSLAIFCILILMISTQLKGIETQSEWMRRYDELRSLRSRIDILTDRVVLVNQSPASIFAPLLTDLSNVFNVLLGYLAFVKLRDLTVILEKCSTKTFGSFCSIEGKFY